MTTPQRRTIEISYDPRTLADAVTDEFGRHLGAQLLADMAAGSAAAADAGKLNEPRGLVTGVHSTDTGDHVSIVKADWIGSRILAEHGRANLRTIGLNVILTCAGRVLLTRRSTKLINGGKLHVSANEGLNVDDLRPGTLGLAPIVRALEEEVGITAIADATYTGLRPSAAGWALGAWAEADMSPQQLCTAMWNAPDRWEGEPMLVDEGTATALLAQPQLWTGYAPDMFALAGLGVQPYTREPVTVAAA